MAENFKLFTSLRYDPALLSNTQPSNTGWNSEKPSAFYMLDYHRDRMLRAATHWGWEKAIAAIEGPEGLALLETFLTKELEPQSDDRPMKTSLENLFPKRLPAPDRSGAVSADEGPPSGQPLWSPAHDVHVYVETHLTPRSEYTHYKTTKRVMYDQARQRAGIGPKDVTKEVLLVDEASGSIMEGTLTTPYFWRGGRWVTPPVPEKFSTTLGSGGQDGTTRRWALKRGVAVEEEINARDVADDETIWLSNGVRGFSPGRIRR